MVKISAIARIAVEQLKGIEDTTKNFLVLPQNQLNTQVTNAINNGQLSFNENLTSKIDTQSLVNNKLTIVKNISSVRPIGAAPVASSGDPVQSLKYIPQTAVSNIGLVANFIPNPISITNASPAVVTFNGYKNTDGSNNGYLYTSGTPIVFSTTDTLPTGITAGTVYYVKPVSRTTFQFSATPGGASVNTTSAGVGVQFVVNENASVSYILVAG